MPRDQQKSCPQCGKTTSPAARWCIGCRFSFEVGVQTAAVEASPAGAGCPVCRGPSGMERLKVRQIGESKTHGVPLVMSVTVTAYQQYLIHGVCSTCDWWIYRNRWLAWLLGLGPIALVLGIAAAQESEALGLLGGVMAIFLMRGLFYSWIDDQVWGQKVIQKLGFPPGDYHIPASALHVLVRGVGGPWLAIMAVALIAVALGK